MIIVKGFASVGIRNLEKDIIIQTKISNTLEEAKIEDSKHSWTSNDIQIREVEIRITNNN